MTTAVQHRRGTTAEHSTFTGLEGEVTIDTTKDTAVIHDGILAGGYPLAKETLANVNPSTLGAITGAATASTDLFLVFDTSTLTMKKITRAELNNAMEIDALANVTITGGTINGTTIGNTAPAAGTFTTLVSDGLDVSTLSGDATIYLQNVASARGMKITKNYDDFSAKFFYSLHPTTEAGSLAFKGSQDSTQLLISSNGDISFYEDTGTTAKFFWDASAESLGIGTAAPLGRLHVVGGATSAYGESFFTHSSATSGLGYKLYLSGLNTTGTRSVILEAEKKDGNAHDFVISTNSSGASPTERLRLDSAGNLGLGVTPSGWGSGSTAFQLGNGGIWKSGSRSVDWIVNGYYNGTNFIYNQTAAATYYRQYDGTHRWNIAPSGTAGAAISFTQAMTLTAAGDLLVGMTTSSSTSAGIRALGVGTITATRSGDSAAVLNRLASDGDILQFRKDTVTVGSIGSVSSNVYIGTGTTGLRFYDAGSAYYPTRPDTQATRDAAIDIGVSFARFKDLYLSGGVYVGGTGAANKLDDYEEGTWTPVLAFGAISGTSITYTGTYTKVGRLVTVHFNAYTATGNLQVSSYASFTGLPFVGTYSGTSTVITEDIDLFSRQGFCSAGPTYFSLSTSGSSSGTTTLRATVTYFV